MLKLKKVVAEATTSTIAKVISLVGKVDAQISTEDQAEVMWGSYFPRPLRGRKSSKDDATNQIVDLLNNDVEVIDIHNGVEGLKEPTVAEYVAAANSGNVEETIEMGIRLHCGGQFIADMAVSSMRRTFKPKEIRFEEVTYPTKDGGVTMPIPKRRESVSIVNGVPTMRLEDPPSLKAWGRNPKAALEFLMQEVMGNLRREMTVSLDGTYLPVKASGICPKYGAWFADGGIVCNELMAGELAVDSDGDMAQVVNVPCAKKDIELVAQRLRVVGHQEADVAEWLQFVAAQKGDEVTMLIVLKVPFTQMWMPLIKTPRMEEKFLPLTEEIDSLVERELEESKTLSENFGKSHLDPQVGIRSTILSTQGVIRAIELAPMPLGLTQEGIQTVIEARRLLIAVNPCDFREKLQVIELDGMKLASKDDLKETPESGWGFSLGYSRTIQERWWMTKGVASPPSLEGAMGMTLQLDGHVDEPTEAGEMRFKKIPRGIDPNLLDRLEAAGVISCVEFTAPGMPAEWPKSLAILRLSLEGNPMSSVMDSSKGYSLLGAVTAFTPTVVWGKNNSGLGAWEGGFTPHLLSGRQYANWVLRSLIGEDSTVKTPQGEPVRLFPRDREDFGIVKYQYFVSAIERAVLELCQKWGETLYVEPKQDAKGTWYPGIPRHVAMEVGNTVGILYPKLPQGFPIAHAIAEMLKHALEANKMLSRKYGLEAAIAGGKKTASMLEHGFFLRRYRVASAGEGTPLLAKEGAHPRRSCAIRTQALRSLEWKEYNVLVTMMSTKTLPLVTPSGVAKQLVDKPLWNGEVSLTPREGYDEVRTLSWHPDQERVVFRSKEQRDPIRVGKIISNEGLKTHTRVYDSLVMAGNVQVDILWPLEDIVDKGLCQAYLSGATKVVATSFEETGKEVQIEGYLVKISLARAGVAGENKAPQRRGLRLLGPQANFANVALWQAGVPAITPEWGSDFLEAYPRMREGLTTLQGATAAPKEREGRIALEGIVAIVGDVAIDHGKEKTQVAPVASLRLDLINCLVVGKDVSPEILAKAEEAGVKIRVDTLGNAAAEYIFAVATKEEKEVAGE